MKPPNAHRILLAFLALALPLAVGGGCTSVRKNYPKNHSETILPPTDTGIASAINATLARQPAGHSGFRLLAYSNEALTARIALADQAVSSLDVQYYIIHDDPTGRLVLKHILAAADRGVRVRLLIDDIHIAGNDRNILALGAHPKIEVRIFNPFKIRQSFALATATQWLLDGRRLNRRMHNKSFIIDGHAAIIGGRNIGDEYFDARQDINFRDLDVLAVGPIVSQISKSFDAFWNSDAAYPLDAFYRRTKTPRKLDRYRATLAETARPFPPTHNIRVLFSPTFAINDGDNDPFKDDEPAPPPSPSLSAPPSPPGAPAPPRFRWCWAPARLVADAPDKANPDDPKKGPHIGEQLAGIITTANNELLLISPYLVPRQHGVDMFASLSKRGVGVKILTNSLASTDVPIVHAGYKRYRVPLLQTGAQLYELRALASAIKKRFFRGKRTGISLHAKAFVIDRRFTFIGSMNIDPRSELLNTEMGVLVESDELSRELAAFFNEAIEPDSSYQLLLAPPDPCGRLKIHWTSETDGQPITHKREPKASIWRRLKNSLLRLLPIEGLL